MPTPWLVDAHRVAIPRNSVLLPNTDIRWFAAARMCHAVAQLVRTSISHGDDTKHCVASNSPSTLASLREALESAGVEMGKARIGCQMPI